MRSLCLDLAGNDVRRLLHAGWRIRDPRALAAITLTAAYGLSLSAIRQLRWRHVGGEGTYLRSNLNGPEDLQITSSLLRQLRAVRPEQFDGRIFSKKANNTASLDRVCAATLVLANLSHLNWNALVAWSRTQTLETRRSIATTQ